MVAANEKKKTENPRASWAHKNQLRLEKHSGKRHFSQAQKQPSSSPRHAVYFSKNWSFRAASSHILGDPAVFWQDGVSEHKKVPFMCRQNYLSNSTWKCLWEIKPYTISHEKQPQDAICCHPNCSRERLLHHWSLHLQHMLLSRPNAKCCLHR